MNHLSIIGAGPCGCLLSIYLARKGYKIDLYEKRPDIRITQSEEGRSINLAISSRGLFALEQAGLRECAGNKLFYIQKIIKLITIG